MFESALLSQNYCRFLAQIRRRYRTHFPTADRIELTKLLTLLPCQEKSTVPGLRACSGFQFKFNSAEHIQPTLLNCPCKIAEIQLSLLFSSGILDWDFEQFETFNALQRTTVKRAWHFNKSLQVNRYEALQLVFSLASAKEFRRAFKEFLSSEQASLFNPAQQASFQFFKKLHAFHNYFFSSGLYFVQWNTLRENVYLDKKRKKLSFLLNEGVGLGDINLVILQMDDYRFRLKATSNSEIALFERLISTLNKSGVGLIVISMQPLLRPKTEPTRYQPDYSKKSFRAGKYGLSLPGAPPRSTVSIQELLPQGCFDRLVECLTLGQHYLEQC